MCIENDSNYQQPITNELLANKKNKELYKQLSTYSPHSKRGIFYRRVLEKLERDKVTIYKKNIKAEIEKQEVFETIEQFNVILKILQTENGNQYKEDELLIEIYSLIEHSEESISDSTVLNADIEAAVIQFLEFYRTIIDAHIANNIPKNGTIIETINTREFPVEEFGLPLSTPEIPANEYILANVIGLDMHKVALRRKESLDFSLLRLDHINSRTSPFSKLQINMSLMPIASLRHVTSGWTDLADSKIEDLLKEGFEEEAYTVAALIELYQEMYPYKLRFDGKVGK